jgi:signal transduction histidine kinase
MTALHGSVDLASEVGAGSTFSIVLPRTRTQGHAATPATADLPPEI